MKSEGIWPLAAKLLLLAVSLALALTAADAFVRIADLGFEPMRNRANDDRQLVRTEFQTRVVTNALGFRDGRLPGPKPAGTMRIVALGDSFTQGYGVEEHEAYPSVLEGLLDRRDPGRRHEVINLGVPGACAIDYLANLRQVGLDYEPDLVLVGVMANDINDLRALREYGGRILPAILRDVRRDLTDERQLWKKVPSTLWPSLYDYAGTRLRHVLGRRDSNAHAAAPEAPSAAARSGRVAIDEDRWREVLLRVAERYGRRSEIEDALTDLPPERIAELRPVLSGHYQFEDAADPGPMFALMSLVQPRAFADMVLLPPRYDAAWNETTRAVRKLAAVADRAEARTLLVFIPAAYQVTPEAWQALESYGFTADPRTLTDTTFLDRLRRFGEEAGVPVVDLLTPLRARADEGLYFPVDGHWTARGHRVAAEAIAAAILSR